MRESDDLFGSLLTYSVSERARTEELHQRMLQQKRRMSEVPAEGASTAGWAEDAVVPAVEEDQAKARLAASNLRMPVPVKGAGDNDEFFVDSNPGGALSSSSLGAGFQWKVKLSAMRKGQYGECCTCGRVASTRGVLLPLPRALVLSRLTPHMSRATVQVCASTTSAR